jgi:hypothetical protein
VAKDIDNRHDTARRSSWNSSYIQSIDQ